MTGFFYDIYMVCTYYLHSLHHLQSMQIIFSRELQNLCSKNKILAENVTYLVEHMNKSVVDLEKKQIFIFLNDLNKGFRHQGLNR